MAKLNLGRVAFVLRGEWAQGAYNKLDVVSYGTTGDSYVSRVDNNTALPTDDFKWLRLTNVGDSVAAANQAAQAANTAAANATAAAASGVRTDTDQGLNDTQKSTARGNIDAASVGEVSDLKSALNVVSNTATDPLINTTDKTSEGVILYETRGYYNAKGVFTPNTAYVMYYFTMPSTQDVWLQAIGANFIELNVFSDELFGTSVAFRRSSVDDIPTQENKLTVTQGHIVSVVISYSLSGRNFNFNYISGLKIKTSNNLTESGIPADAKTVGDLLLPLANTKRCAFKYRAVQHEEGNPNLDNNIYYTDGATHVLSIYIPTTVGYVNYNVGRCAKRTQSEGGFDVTRMCVLYAVNDNLEKRFEVTRAGEWEMAVKIKNSDDFIGGYEHGDEWETDCEYFVDGKKVDITSFTNLTNFGEIRVKNNSNMYDPNDHETLVGIHGREWVFTKECVTLYQSIRWLFNTDTQMTSSYMAMLPMIRGNDTTSDIQITDHFYNDVNFDDVDCSVGGAFTGEFPDEAKMTGIYGIISGVNAKMEVLEYPYYPDSRYNFLNATVNKANKIYYGVCGKGTTYGTVTVGQIWKSKAIYNIAIAEGQE